jgi:hypothetical protein
MRSIFMQTVFLDLLNLLLQTPRERSQRNDLFFLALVVHKHVQQLLPQANSTLVLAVIVAELLRRGTSTTTIVITACSSSFHNLGFLALRCLLWDR